MALVPFVLAHLATILVIGKAGLTAEQVLNRTHGSFGWAAFYSFFVLLISLHGSVGLWQLGRLFESPGDRFRLVIVGSMAGLFGALTFVLGARAIAGLYGAVPPG